MRYSGIPLPQRHLILAALEISNEAGVVIWSSVKSLSVETKMSERTIYHRRRRMRKLGLWEAVRAPYTWDDCPKCGAGRETRICSRCNYEGSTKEFRRPPTFRLNLDKIASWPRPKGVRPGSYKEYRTSPDYPARKQQAAEHRSPQRPKAKPSPVPISRQHGISRAQQRQIEMRQKLGTRVAQLMKGVSRISAPEGGLGYVVRPGDEGYVAPMSQVDAECAAAKELGLSFDDAHDLLKGWSYAPPKRE